MIRPRNHIKTRRHTVYVEVTNDIGREYRRTGAFPEKRNLKNYGPRYYNIIRVSSSADVVGVIILLFYYFVYYFTKLCSSNRVRTDSSVTIDYYIIINRLISNAVFMWFRRLFQTQRRLDAGQSNTAVAVSQYKI